MKNGVVCRIPGRTGAFLAALEPGGISDLAPFGGECDPLETVWISPGLFDIQVNGMLGFNLSDDGLTVEMVEAIDKGLARKGVTRWCPTITTQDSAIVGRNLAVIAEAMDTGAAPGAHCIHMEGHYISAEEGYRGIHMERFIRDPDSEEFDRWQKMAGGHIGLFSLAPERRGAIPFIRKLKKEGVRVGLVHHHADYDTIRDAVASGADLSSHLVNGCAKMIHRQHNVIWAQLSIDELWASFIPDGFHIPPYTLKTVLRAKGWERSILISDLAHLSGMPEGEYKKNGLTVVMKDGGLWVKGEGTNLLSGAAKTLEEGCEYAANNGVCSLERALLMASVNPATYMGIRRAFDLFPGYRGPLAVFSWKAPKLTVKTYGA